MAREVERLRDTAFGRVLAELLEKRELPVTPFHVGKLAEEAGLDGWKIINRMASVGAEDPGYLDGLATALELDRGEMVRLSMAYVFEKEVASPTEQLPIGRVLEEIARKRGYSDLEELASAVTERTGEYYSAAVLADWPPAGFGADVDEVLHLSNEERDQLTNAMVARINQGRRK